MVFVAFLLGARHLGVVVEKKPASSLVVFLGKALIGTPPLSCGRKVAQTPWKSELPNECGCPNNSDTIRFLVNVKQKCAIQYKNNMRV